MPEFLRLIRFSKLAALVAGVWTILYVVLIGGWQATMFLRDGNWPNLPLSTFFKLEIGPGAIYTTASGATIDNSPLATVINGLLQIPTIVLFLLAAALLTAFYLWLTQTEKRQLKR